MKIKRVYIKNITVFNEVEIEFSHDINVFIGTNGMGKTHLLKLLYMYNSAKSIGKSSIEDLFGADDIDLLRDISKESLVVAHMPKNFEDKSNIKKMLELNEISMLWDKNSEEYSYTKISVHGEKVKDEQVLVLRQEGLSAINNCIFIPSKEILSNSKGFLALNHQRKLSFDKTYADIIANAELPESRNLSEMSRKLLETISEIIGGTVTHEEGSFYIKKNNAGKMIFSLEAEGFRKFGLLWKLIQNGLFEEDTKLFWDEPEANINPELIPTLVDILLALQKSGVQIFIATHNYNLAKYFEIKNTEKNTILYHGMSMTETGVKVDSYSLFSDIPNNPIIEADSLLLDEIYGFECRGDR